MHRLFVAIRPPRGMRERLLAAMGGIPNARWQSDEQLHLTLRFIGEVDRHRADDVAATLGTIHHSALALAVEGVGHFGSKGRIETLWAGVAPNPPLTALHAKIEQALVRAGLPHGGRAYLPHVTLARFSRGAGRIDELPSFPHIPAGPPCDIREFCLFESLLGGSGATYSIVARYPLG